MTYLIHNISFLKLANNGVIIYMSQGKEVVFVEIKLAKEVNIKDRYLLNL